MHLFVSITWGCFTLPVMAFMLLAVYGRNIPLAAAVVILGVGHIGIHWMHKREIGT